MIPGPNEDSLDGYAGGEADRMNRLYGALGSLQAAGGPLASDAIAFYSRITGPRTADTNSETFWKRVKEAAVDPVFATLVEALRKQRVLPSHINSNPLKPEGPVQQAAKGITRRTVLTTGVVGAAALGAEEIGFLEKGTTADLGSAGAVLGGFLNHVLVRGVRQGIPLGPESATDMALLAGGRIAALQLLGGPHGAERARHEIGEIEHGLLPLPVLLGLSDATTAEGHFNVNAKAIFEKVEGALVKDLDYATVSRPSLGDSLEVWEGRLGKINQDLIAQTAQIAAITAVLAPLGTTYTSSSLSNRLKQEVLRMLYEQSYALRVVEIHKRNGQGVFDDKVAQQMGAIEELNPQALHDAAKKRAENLFNGPLGYSKLMLTLSANIQGVLGLGDPPEIYFIIDQLSNEDPEGILISNAIGAGVSESYTFLLTAGWLAAAGVPTGSAAFGKAFLEGESTTLQTLKSTLGNKDLRDVSFRSGTGEAKRFIAALRAKGGDQRAQLAAVVAAIPEARLQFNPLTYVEEKIRILGGMEGRLAVAMEEPTVQELLRKPGRAGVLEDLRKGHWFKELFEDMQAGRVGEARKKIKALMELAQGREADRLATLLEGMMDQVPYSTEGMSEAPEQEQESNPEEGGSIDQMLDLVEEIVREFGTLSADTQKGRLEDVLSELGSREKLADVDMAALKDRLFSADEATVQAALQKLTQVGGKEDAIEGVETAQKTSHLRHKAHLLSHSAKEVLWALLTQIPSVPGIARIVEEVAPAMAGVEHGEKPNRQQLKNITATVLVLTAAMSSSADNVAAYIFAAGVLLHFFKKVFGEERVEQDKVLKRTIRIIAKLIAEIAGCLSQLGNGPNFSQEAMEIVQDNSNSQGIGINRVKENLADTLPHKNVFSSVANLVALGAGIKILWNKIDAVSEELSHSDAPLETMGKLEPANDRRETVEETRHAVITRRLFFGGRGRSDAASAA